MWELNLKAEHDTALLRTKSGWLHLFYISIAHSHLRLIWLTPLSVNSSLSKLNIIQKTQDEKLQVLAELQVKNAYTLAYFADQWTRQKKVQSEVIGDTDLQSLQSQLEELIEYEEDLREAKHIHFDFSYLLFA